MCIEAANSKATESAPVLNMTCHFDVTDVCGYNYLALIYVFSGVEAAWHANLGFAHGQCLV